MSWASSARRKVKSEWRVRERATYRCVRLRSAEWCSKPAGSAYKKLVVIARCDSQFSASRNTCCCSRVGIQDRLQTAPRVHHHQGRFVGSVRKPKLCSGPVARLQHTVLHAGAAAPDTTQSHLIVILLINKQNNINKQTTNNNTTNQAKKSRQLIQHHMLSNSQHSCTSADQQQLYITTPTLCSHPSSSLPSSHCGK